MPENLDHSNADWKGMWMESINSSISLCEQLGEEGKSHLQLFNHYHHAITTLHAEAPGQNEQAITAQIQMFLHMTHPIHEELCKQATAKKLTQLVKVCQEKRQALSRAAANSRATPQSMPVVSTNPTLIELLNQGDKWKTKQEIKAQDFLNWLDQIVQKVGQLLENDASESLDREDVKRLTNMISNYLPKLKLESTDLPRSVTELTLVRSLIKQLSGQLETLNASVLQGVGG